MGTGLRESIFGDGGVSNLDSAPDGKLRAAKLDASDESLDLLSDRSRLPGGSKRDTLPFRRYRPGERSRLTDRLYLVGDCAGGGVWRFLKVDRPLERDRKRGLWVRDLARERSLPRD